MGKGERGMYEGPYLFVTKLFGFDAHFNLTHLLIHYYIIRVLNAIHIKKGGQLVKLLNIFL